MNSKSQSPFVDILSDRRKSSDLLWIARAIKFEKTYKSLQTQQCPETLKWIVLESEQMNKLVDEMSVKLKESREEVRLKVIHILEEVGFSRNLLVIRSLALLLMKILRNTTSAIYVNETKLNELRKKWGNTPVLLLPTHRSYGDFILMAFVSFVYDIEIPCVAAGMDFQNMLLMGSMLRECSAFFMRRKFGGDQLYWTVFDIYVQHLVKSCEKPLEFFIEGTRSRTGKSLYPKLGLLSMMINPMLKGEVEDLLIVPISISYDRCLEEELFSGELIGIPKPKESTFGFLRAIKSLKQQYGNIYVNFADPFYAKDFFIKMDTKIHFDKILNLGHEILIRQQQASILSVFNVLAILCTHHSISSSPTTLPQITHEVLRLISILEQFHATVKVDKENISDEIIDSLSVHQSLLKFEDDVISIAPNQMNFVSGKVGKVKGHELSVMIMQKSLPLISLQNYINPCLFHLISPAFICVLRKQLSGYFKLENWYPDTLEKKYFCLRQIFKHEFVFYDPFGRSILDDSLEVLQKMSKAQSVLEMINLKSASSHNDYQFLESLSSSLLYPFVFGYHTVYTILMEKISIDDKSLLKEVQHRVEASLLSDTLRHPYPLSLELVQCCLASLEELDAVRKEKRDSTVWYTIKPHTLQMLLIEVSDFLNTIVSNIPNHKSISTIDLKAKL